MIVDRPRDSMRENSNRFRIHTVCFNPPDIYANTLASRKINLNHIPAAIRRHGSRYVIFQCYNQLRPLTEQRIQHVQVNGYAGIMPLNLVLFALWFLDFAPVITKP